MMSSFACVFKFSTFEWLIQALITEKICSSKELKKSCRKHTFKIG